VIRVRGSIGRMLARGWLNLNHRIRFVREFRRFAAGDTRFDVRWRNRNMIYQLEAETNSFSPGYLYHMSWAARVLAAAPPKRHVDIASWVYFPALVSAFMPIDFYEFQPSAVRLDNLECGTADLTALQFEDNSIDSLSCMHTVEHIGLGRYGDPIDPEGDLKAMRELSRVLAPGGQLLFVVPTGPPRVEFNAHRHYAYAQVLAAFPDLRLVEFSYIPSDVMTRGPIPNASEADVLADRWAGDGCYLFRKDG
jgi:SAM-dependent methyltransferase